MPYKVLCISLVRHGQCVGNVTKSYHENPDPLTERGKRQAARLGKKWKNVHIDKIYSSDMERAVDTAKALADANAGKPDLGSCPLAYEREYGDYVWRLVGSRRFADEVQGLSSYDGTPDRNHCPRSGGESLNDVAHRAFLTLHFLLDTHAKTVGSDSEEPYEFPTVENPHDPESLPDDIPHIVLVSHNVLLTEMYECILQWNTPGWCSNYDHAWSNYKLENAEWSRHVLCWKTDIQAGEGGTRPKCAHYGLLESETLVKRAAAA